MRVIVIDPEIQSIEEREIDGGYASFRRILVGRPIFGTFFEGDALFLSEWPRSFYYFKFGDAWISGKAIVAGLGSGSRGFHVGAKSTISGVKDSVSWDDAGDLPTYVQWLNERWMAHYTEKERMALLFRRSALRRR